MRWLGVEETVGAWVRKSWARLGIGLSSSELLSGVFNTSFLMEMTGLRYIQINMAVYWVGRGG